MENGLSNSDHGSHSNRKGSSTYCSSFPGGPSAIQIFLRAGWSLGKVVERYIKQGDGGGDQFVGRVACGLPLMDAEFAMLPPHFTSDHGLVDADWNIIIDGFDDYPDGFKVAIPFVVASVVYHREYLIQTLPSNHLLFRSRLWTQNYHVRLAPFVVCGIFRCSHTGLAATGVTLLKHCYHDISEGSYY
jgi:hypothetical protein